MRNVQLCVNELLDILFKNFPVVPGPEIVPKRQVTVLLFCRRVADSQILVIK